MLGVFRSSSELLGTARLLQEDTRRCLQLLGMSEGAALGPPWGPGRTCKCS